MRTGWRGRGKNLGKHGVRGKSSDVDVPRAATSGEMSSAACRVSNWAVMFTRLDARVTLDGRAMMGVGQHSWWNWSSKQEKGCHIYGLFLFRVRKLWLYFFIEIPQIS